MFKCKVFLNSYFHVLKKKSVFFTWHYCNLSTVSVSFGKWNKKTYHKTTGFPFCMVQLLYCKASIYFVIYLWHSQKKNQYFYSYLLLHALILQMALILLFSSIVHWFNFWNYTALHILREIDALFVYASICIFFFFK